MSALWTREALKTAGSRSQVQDPPDTFSIPYETSTENDDTYKGKDLLAKCLTEE